MARDAGRRGAAAEPLGHDGGPADGKRPRRRAPHRPPENAAGRSRSTPDRCPPAEATRATATCRTAPWSAAGARGGRGRETPGARPRTRCGHGSLWRRHGEPPRRPQGWTWARGTRLAPGQVRTGPGDSERKLLPAPGKSRLHARGEAVGRGGRTRTGAVMSPVLPGRTPQPAPAAWAAGNGAQRAAGPARTDPSRPRPGPIPAPGPRGRARCRQVRPPAYPGDDCGGPGGRRQQEQEQQEQQRGAARAPHGASGLAQPGPLGAVGGGGRLPRASGRL